MRIINYLSIIRFVIALFVTVLLIYMPIIQWSVLIDIFLRENHDFFRIILEGFNFRGSKDAVQSGFQFFLAILLICYITMLSEVKGQEFLQLLIFIFVSCIFLSLIIEPSFFKLSSILSLLLLGLALLTKNRIYSVVLISLSLMSNISIALPSGIILCAANQFREYKFVFRPRFILVMIDAGLLTFIFFIVMFL